MDDRLEKALDLANFQRTLTLRKLNLFEAFEHNLLINYSDNIFLITLELLNYVSNNLSNEYLIILDINNEPVKINKEEINKFYNLLDTQYKNSILEFYNEIEKLKKVRSVEKIVQ